MRGLKPLWAVALLVLALSVPAAAVVPAVAAAHSRHPATHHRAHHSKRHKHRRALHRRRHLRRQVHAKGPTVAGTARARSAVRAATISGVSYFVSPSGSDSNSGTSPGQAWRTIGRVNSAVLQAGDGVLFQGGQTFSDTTLMPNVSGTSNAPIVFGSYGTGQATITKGVWFIDHDHLTFDNLALGPDSGLQGGNSSGHTANGIVVQRCTISLSASNPQVGIDATGNHWTIAGNTVQNIGNSGMLLLGDSYTISGNTIANTGLDPSITYAKHGIYLKVSNATVTSNTITNFSSDGISPRYHSSTLTNNHISGGSIGIGYFEMDTIPGTSHWTGNTITNTTDTGMFVCGTAESCSEPLDSFTITGNTIAAPATNRARWEKMNLQPIAGTYTVADNPVS